MKNEKKKILKRFYRKIKTQFKIAAFSVYEFEVDEEEDIAWTFGNKLENERIIEKYCDFSRTVLLSDQEGLPESPKYKSRLITKVSAGNTVFMAVFSSFDFEAFGGENAKKIFQALNQLPLGENSDAITEKKTANSKIVFSVCLFAVLIAAGVVTYSQITIGNEKLTETTATEPAEIESETIAEPEESEIPATIPPLTNAAESDPVLSSVTATSATTSESTTATTAEITTATSTTVSSARPSTTSSSATATSKSTAAVTTPKPTTSTTAATVNSQPSTVNCSSPTSLRITANAGNIEFSWSAIDGADGYEVSRSITQIGGYSAVTSPTIRDGGRVRISDSSVKSGTTYYYSVRAFKNVGNERIYSDYSEVVSIMTR